MSNDKATFDTALAQQTCKEIDEAKVVVAMLLPFVENGQLAASSEAHIAIFIPALLHVRELLWCVGRKLQINSTD